MAANKGLSKPQLLTIPQLADVHHNHPATGKAIATIVDYLNANATTGDLVLTGTVAQQLQQLQNHINANSFPKQGTKVAPR